MTPEEAERVRKEYGLNFQRKLEEGIAKVIRDRFRKIVSIEEKETNVRQFLLAEYRGNCQICNTRLDVGQQKDHLL